MAFSNDLIDITWTRFSSVTLAEVEYVLLTTHLSEHVYAIEYKYAVERADSKRTIIFLYGDELIILEDNVAKYLQDLPQIDERGLPIRRPPEDYADRLLRNLINQYTTRPRRDSRHDN
jgi:hypothetical protein